MNLIVQCPRYVRTIVGRRRFNPRHFTLSPILQDNFLFFRMSFPTPFSGNSTVILSFTSQTNKLIYLVQTTTLAGQMAKCRPNLSRRTFWRQPNEAFKQGTNCWNNYSRFCKTNNKTLKQIFSLWSSILQWCSGIEQLEQASSGQQSSPRITISVKSCNKIWWYDFSGAFWRE